MADLFTVSAPLVLRHPDGQEEVLAALFPHEDGLLYFQLYWHLGAPDECIHRIAGDVSGEGPWRIGDHRLRVLGCQGSDGELALVYDAWQAYLAQAQQDYPPPPLIAAIARRLGACP